jgi:hypothetical protein
MEDGRNEVLCSLYFPPRILRVIIQIIGVEMDGTCKTWERRVIPTKLQ